MIRPFLPDKIKQRVSILFITDPVIYYADTHLFLDSVSHTLLIVDSHARCWFPQHFKELLLTTCPASRVWRGGSRHRKGMSGLDQSADSIREAPATDCRPPNRWHLRGCADWTALGGMIPHTRRHTHTHTHTVLTHLWSMSMSAPIKETLKVMFVQSMMQVSTATWQPCLGSLTVQVVGSMRETVCEAFNTGLMFSCC